MHNSCTLSPSKVLPDHLPDTIRIGFLNALDSQINRLASGLVLARRPFDELKLLNKNEQCSPEHTNSVRLLQIQCAQLKNVLDDLCMPQDQIFFLLTQQGKDLHKSICAVEKAALEFLKTCTDAVDAHSNYKVDAYNHFVHTVQLCSTVLKRNQENLYNNLRTYCAIYSRTDQTEDAQNKALDTLQQTILSQQKEPNFIPAMMHFLCRMIPLLLKQKASYVGFEDILNAVALKEAQHGWNRVIQIIRSIWEPSTGCAEQGAQSLAALRQLCQERNAIIQNTALDDTEEHRSGFFDLLKETAELLCAPHEAPITVLMAGRIKTVLIAQTDGKAAAIPWDTAPKELLNQMKANEMLVVSGLGLSMPHWFAYMQELWNTEKKDLLKKCVQDLETLYPNVYARWSQRSKDWRLLFMYIQNGSIRIAQLLRDLSAGLQRGGVHTMGYTNAHGALDHAHRAGPAAEQAIHYFFETIKIKPLPSLIQKIAIQEKTESECTLSGILKRLYESDQCVEVLSHTINDYLAKKNDPNHFLNTSVSITSDQLPVSISNASDTVALPIQFLHQVLERVVIRTPDQLINWLNLIPESQFNFYFQLVFPNVRDDTLKIWFIPMLIDGLSTFENILIHLTLPKRFLFLKACFKQYSQYFHQIIHVFSFMKLMKLCEITSFEALNNVIKNTDTDTDTIKFLFKASQCNSVNEKLSFLAANQNTLKQLIWIKKIRDQDKNLRVSEKFVLFCETIHIKNTEDILLVTDLVTHQYQFVWSDFFNDSTRNRYDFFNDSTCNRYDFLIFCSALKFTGTSEEILNQIKTHFDIQKWFTEIISSKENKLDPINEVKEQIDSLFSILKLEKTEQILRFVTTYCEDLQLFFRIGHFKLLDLWDTLKISTSTEMLKFFQDYHEDAGKLIKKLFKDPRNLNKGYFKNLNTQETLEFINTYYDGGVRVLFEQKIEYFYNLENIFLALKLNTRGAIDAFLKTNLEIRHLIQVFSRSFCSDFFLKEIDLDIPLLHQFTAYDQKFVKNREKNFDFYFMKLNCFFKALKLEYSQDILQFFTEYEMDVQQLLTHSAPTVQHLERLFSTCQLNTPAERLYFFETGTQHTLWFDQCIKKMNDLLVLMNSFSFDDRLEAPWNFLKKSTSNLEKFLTHVLFHIGDHTQLMAILKLDTPTKRSDFFQSGEPEKKFLLKAMHGVMKKLFLSALNGLKSRVQDKESVFSRLLFWNSDPLCKRIQIICYKINNLIDFRVQCVEALQILKENNLDRHAEILQEQYNALMPDEIKEIENRNHPVNHVPRLT